MQCIAAVGLQGPCERDGEHSPPLEAEICGRSFLQTFGSAGAGKVWGGTSMRSCAEPQHSISFRVRTKPGGTVSRFDASDSIVA